MAVTHLDLYPHDPVILAFRDLGNRLIFFSSAMNQDARSSLDTDANIYASSIVSGAVPGHSAKRGYMPIAADGLSRWASLHWLVTLTQMLIRGLGPVKRMRGPPHSNGYRGAPAMYILPRCTCYT